MFLFGRVARTLDYAEGARLGVLRAGLGSRLSSFENERSREIRGTDRQFPHPSPRNRNLRKRSGLLTGGPDS